MSKEEIKQLKGVCVMAKATTSNKDKIKQAFAGKKSLTDLELAGLVSMNPNSVRPCRLSLQRIGYIKKTDTKRKGYTVYSLNTDFNEKNSKKKASKSKIIKAIRKSRMTLYKLYKELGDLLNRV